jgi:hypothetical protein
VSHQWITLSCIVVDLSQKQKVFKNFSICYTLSIYLRWQLHKVWLTKIFSENLLFFWVTTWQRCPWRCDRCRRRYRRGGGGAVAVDIFKQPSRQRRGSGRFFWRSIKKYKNLDTNSMSASANYEIRRILSISNKSFSPKQSLW